MPEFLALSEDKQKEILRNLLLPLIQKHADKVTALKIMEMLIDYNVFEVDDIMEFLENENVLKEKIDRAKKYFQSKT